MTDPDRETLAASQRRSRTFGDELRQLARLAGPIALVQLGTNLLHFTDVAMLGHQSPAALPAMALGNSLTFCVLMFTFGVMTAADPLLSQAIGARDEAAIARVLGRTGLLAVLLAVPSAFVLLPSRLWLTWLGQPPALLDGATIYAQLQGLGILPYLWYSLLRSLLSAHARVWPQVVTILAGNLANVLLDWWLIFGGLGVPPLGSTGAAIATVSVRWAMLLVLLWCSRDLLAALAPRLREPAARREAFAPRELRSALRHGVPVGFQLLLEIGIFAAAALVIGRLDSLGGEPGAVGAGLSGHQIAMQLAALSFMFPLGIGIAASVRVGWAVGRADPAATRRSVQAALTAGGAVMMVFMFIFLLWPGPLARLLGDHDEALAVAAALIPIAGVFQIVDGLQVVAVGCLRGLGDLRSPVLANLLGFWLCGLPVGAALAFRTEAGPAGMWWGLVVGLALVAAILLLVLRWRLRERRPRLSLR